MLNLVRGVWRMIIVFFLMMISINVSTTERQAVMAMVLSFLAVIIVCIQGALEDEEKLND